MTPTYEAATEFASRITGEITDERALWDDTPRMQALIDADRLHAAAFLRAIERAEEGLRDHSGVYGERYCERCDDETPCADARRYTEARDEAWAGLVRIGSTYGEKP